MTFRDRLAAYFREHEGRWIDGQELATVGGVYAWRSRCAELRTQLGMTIENRQRRQGRRLISEYCYHAPTGGQVSLF